jgi:peptide chain release factor
MELIQISAGRGPVECSLVVWKVYEKLIETARAQSLSVTLIDKEPDREKDTYKSITISISGENESHFCSEWVGTVQWTVQSPFRPHHKRKNWFVSVNVIPVFKEETFSLNDVRIETLRSSGAGGQHVNKTESGVRAIHLPTNTVVLITNERSQYQNKMIALSLLAHKIQERNFEKKENLEKQVWQIHNELIRGNPVRKFKG